MQSSMKVAEGKPLSGCEPTVQDYSIKAEAEGGESLEFRYIAPD